MHFNAHLMHTQLHTTPHKLTHAPERDDDDAGIPG